MHIPIQCLPGALPPGVKRPGLEADHVLPSSAEVENDWSFTSLLQCVIKACIGTILPLPFYLIHLPTVSLKGQRLNSRKWTGVHYVKFTFIDL